MNSLKDCKLLIESMAKTEYNRQNTLPRVDLSELVQIGYIALWQLKEGEYTKSYICNTVRWAMKNHLRKNYKYFQRNIFGNISLNAEGVEQDWFDNLEYTEDNTNLKESLYFEKLKEALEIRIMLLTPVDAQIIRMKLANYTFAQIGKRFKMDATSVQRRFWRASKIMKGNKKYKPHTLVKERQKYAEFY
jgi:RNA polymerase sigma factor (sigma-70 family)